MRNNKLIFILLVLLIAYLYGQGPKTLGQYVKNWPAGYDTTGKYWTVFQKKAPETHFLLPTSVGSGTNYAGAPNNFIQWYVNIGNFNGGVNAWFPGDTIIIIGSMDTAYVNSPGSYGGKVTHTGFYWIFGNTVNSATPEFWSECSLYVMPKPIVTKTGAGGGENDTIWIEIPNPKEVRYTGQDYYDVLGYWIVADSTGTGVPDSFYSPRAVAIDFIPVQGVYGENTVFYMLESDSFAPWDLYDVYFAYKIVARPDTIGGYYRDAPGYCTYYFSQNSDMIQVYQNVVGVKEQKSPKVKTELRYVFPNPFVHTAKIAYALATAAHVELRVYDVAGQLVQAVLNEAQSAGEHVVEFDGALLPSGVYFYQLETNEKKFSGRLVKLE
jgi:hypothetical protein